MLAIGIAENPVTDGVAAERHANSMLLLGCNCVYQSADASELDR